MLIHREQTLNVDPIIQIQSVLSDIINSSHPAGPCHLSRCMVQYCRPLPHDPKLYSEAENSWDASGYGDKNRPILLTVCFLVKTSRRQCNLLVIIVSHSWTLVVEYSFSHCDMAPSVRLCQPLMEGKALISNEEARLRRSSPESGSSGRSLGSRLQISTSDMSLNWAQTDVDPIKPILTHINL